MKKLAVIAAAALALGFGASASADGVESNGVNVVRLGKAGGNAVTVKKEHGVTVYRGAAVKREAMLAGGAPSKAAAKPAVIERTKVIVEHHYHSRIRYLRTQGFYAGHPGKSRRFTQGFYSGPVDKGRN